MAKAIITNLPANGSVVDATPLSAALNALAIAVNAIDSTQLVAGSVTSPALANGSVEATHLAANSVTSTAIASASVETVHIAAGSITAAKIAAGVIPTSYTPTAGSVSSSILQRADQLSQMGWFSVKDYGALGNGANDDTVAINSAHSAAYTAGSGIYFPPGTYVLSAAVTYSVPTQFTAGAKLALASGHVATFTGSISSGPYQIFQGAGTVSINGNTPFLFAEWWGAKGDAATDDTAAINAALNAGTGPGTGGGGANSPTVQLLAKSYAHGSPIIIRRSGITLQGMGSGVTYLLATNNTFDSLQITGSSGSYLQYVMVRDLAIQTLNLVAQTASGIKISFVNFCKIHDIRITFHAIGVYLNGTNAAEIHNVLASPVAGSPAVCYGFYIDGTHANNSTNITECNVNGYGATPTTSYGYYAAGANINDLFLNGCEAGAWQYGFYVDGTNATTNGAVDIHFKRCIADACSINAFHITSMPITAQLEIDSGWACADGAAANTTAILVYGSYGVTVRNMHVFQVLGATSCVGIELQNSTSCCVQNNSIHNFQTGIVVLMSGACSVTGNELFNNAGVASPLSGIHLTSTATRNDVSHNVINGANASSWTTGILADSGCDYCSIIGNILSPGAMGTMLSNNSANTHSYIAGVLT